MHSELRALISGTSDKIGAQRVVLGQIRSKVHLLPLELLFDVIVPREPEFSYVPASYKVNLACSWLLIYDVRVRFVRNKDLLGIACKVGAVMTQKKGIFQAGQPIVKFEFQKAVLIIVVI